MEAHTPTDILDRFPIINSAPDPDRAEKFARLVFPDYPNIPGDDDDIPFDSPLMTLLRENLPSTSFASDPRWSQRRRKGKGRQGHPSRSDPDATVGEGSHSGAHDQVDMGQSFDDRIHELRTASNELIADMKSRQEQKATDSQAKRDFQRWLYEEKFAESQRQREHEQKMEAVKMEMEARLMEHKKQMIEPENRKLQLEIELQQLKNQELMMRKGVASSGEGDLN